MKLKCDKHDRRLMILKGDKWVHRTEDLSDCDSISASIGDETVERGDIPIGTDDSVREEIDSSMRLIYDIFTTQR